MRWGMGISVGLYHHTAARRLGSNLSFATYCYVIVIKSLPLLEPQFLHLYNGCNNIALPD